MRLALDTNRITDLFRGDAAVLDLVENADEVLVPFVCLGELRAGFARGKRALQNERDLRRFLQKPGVATLFATDATTQTYAALYRQLRQQGTPIPTNDLWIAALVVEHGLSLSTRDRQFAALPQIWMV